MKTVAIIQARMGSRRLPGKVLRDIGGRSLLGFLVDRLYGAETLDETLVATTTLPQDDAIVDECKRLGVPWFRGSESDVLKRYYEAALASSAQIVVRVTADNPFTDPASIDRVVLHLRATGDAYGIETGLPVGTTGEALTFSALAFLTAVANQPVWREHVTLYLKEHPDSLPTAVLPSQPGCNRPDLSFTIDRTTDYEYVCKLAARLRSPHFPLNKAIEIADELGCEETVVGCQ